MLSFIIGDMKQFARRGPEHKQIFVGDTLTEVAGGELLSL